MADAKKCDRCGIFYEEETVTIYEKEVDSIGLYGGNNFGRDLDLCPKCLESLKSWLEGEDVEAKWENSPILKKAIEIYGVEAQKYMVIEECSELIQAICKTKRSTTPQTLDHEAEETADAIIMLIQQRQMVGEKLVDEWIAKKISMLEERLEEL